MDLDKQRSDILDKLTYKYEIIDGVVKKFSEKELVKLSWEYEKLTQQIIDRDEEERHKQFLLEKIYTYKYELIGKNKMENKIRSRE